MGHALFERRAHVIPLNNQRVAKCGSLYSIQKCFSITIPSLLVFCLVEVSFIDIMLPTMRYAGLFKKIEYRVFIT